MYHQSDWNCTNGGTFSINCKDFSNFFNNYNIKHFHIKKSDILNQATQNMFQHWQFIFFMHFTHQCMFCPKWSKLYLLPYVKSSAQLLFYTLRKSTTIKRTEQWLHTFETTISTHCRALNLKRRYCHFCLRVLISAILALSMVVNKRDKGEVTFNGM